MKKHILAVKQMQDYIQEHVREDITLADLTPAEYIRKIRLNVSSKALKSEENRVIDVAYS